MGFLSYYERRMEYEILIYKEDSYKGYLYWEGRKLGGVCIDSTKDGCIEKLTVWLANIHKIEFI